MLRCLSKVGKKPGTILCLVAIAGFATLVRCLHLLNPDHFYIVSPDSHFFHWEAARILTGQDIPYPASTGLTYPLAYISSVIGLLAGIQPMEALTVSCKILPPALGIISVVVIYMAASRMYNWRVGLGAAFSWAILTYAYSMQAAGYLDRDGLSVLLLMTGVFLFHFARGWRLTLANRNIGWVIGALAVITVEGVLVLEWLWLGAVLLVSVLSAYVILEVCVTCFPFLARALTAVVERLDFLSAARLSLTGSIAAIKKSNWRALVLILGTNVVIGAVSPGIPLIYGYARDILRDAFGHTADVAELQGMSAGDIFAYGALLLPLLVGLYFLIARRRKADILCFSWLFFLFVAGLFARRLFWYAAPAACIICGVGLAWIFDFGAASKSPTAIGSGASMMMLPSARLIKMCAAIALIVILLLGSSFGAYQYGTGGRVAANTQWQAALSYLEQETPEDAVVMSWWDYGYWILDMANRRPVVDNGHYGWDQQRLEDVGLAYCTADPSEAARVMQKYESLGGGHHPVYLVFSRVEGGLQFIGRYGTGDPEVAPRDLRESVYYRSLHGTLESGDGLRMVYPSPEVSNPEVVILGLE